MAGMISGVTEGVRDGVPVVLALPESVPDGEGVSVPEPEAVAVALGVPEGDADPVADGDPEAERVAATLPLPEPLDMHCCAVCSAAWCLQCLDRIDAKPSEARDCPSCHRGRVMEVPRLFVMACIPEGGRLPRVVLNRLDEQLAPADAAPVEQLDALARRERFRSAVDVLRTDAELGEQRARLGARLWRPRQGPQH
jgi:hypothetical protein